MAFVVDASIILASLLPDEGSAAADRVLARLASEPVQAPALLLLEVGNALVQAGRRQRIERSMVDEMLRAFLELPIALDPTAPGPMLRAGELASRHAVTLYDACYLELALRRGWPLATLDAALGRAALAEGVVLAHA
jgi:predicted nucleic acid-binding protein